MNMNETVNTPPPTVPVLSEKIRQMRIQRHNRVQMQFAPIPIHSTPDPTAWILSQLTRGAVTGGMPA